MRRFLVLAHTQLDRAPLPLNDPSGAGGRWDLLARCVTNALLVSHGARADTEVLLALLRASPPRVVRVAGAQVRNLNPDERSTVALASKALEATDVGAHESSPIPGFYVSRRSLDEVLEAVGRDGPVVMLTERAPASLEGWNPESTGATFVLGDHRDPSPGEASTVRRYATRDLSLGPVEIQSDQCIAVVHNRLDRLGAAGLAPRPAASEK